MWKKADIQVHLNKLECREKVTAHESQKSVFQNIRIFTLSFNKWPSIQYKLWVTLVL